MNATIADLRRGDRFTWANTEWIAVYDAIPSAADPAATNDPGFHSVRFVKATDHQPGSDGVIEILRVGAETILSTKKITIHERGLRIHSPADDIRPDTPLWQTKNGLETVVAARSLAQRQIDDADEEFNNYVRRAIAGGMPVPQITAITGLSKQRISQINRHTR